MKYLKTYENLNIEPKIGDYVIIDPSPKNYTSTFINISKNSIAKVVGFSIRDDKHAKKRYKIRYLNSSIEYMDLDWAFPIEDIAYFSPNIKDCELYILSKKYNL